MDSFFGPVPNNPLNIELSKNIENWPLFNNIFDVNSNVNSPLIPCMLFGVHVKTTGV